AVLRTPLPPYVLSRDGDDQYNTVFAKDAGSVAAPTAGLHFTEDTLRRCRDDAGCTVDEVTLHVGYGTFAHIEADALSEHKMHAERLFLSESTAARLGEHAAAGRALLAVGTTATRTLETCAADTPQGEPASFVPTGAAGKDTELFICEGVPETGGYPDGHDWKAVGALLTNFHMPGLTPIGDTGGKYGYDLVMRAYKEAISERYRFFSFGDAMLVRLRVDATRAAWSKLGRFWNQHTSLKLKRLAFSWVIHSAAFSGLEVYTLGKREFAKLDSVILGPIGSRLAMDPFSYPLNSMRPVPLKFLQSLKVPLKSSTVSIQATAGTLVARPFVNPCLEPYWLKASFLVHSSGAENSPLGAAIGFAAEIEVAAVAQAARPQHARALNDVWAATDNHYGLREGGLTDMQTMPIQWVQAMTPILMRMALGHEHRLRLVESAFFRHVQLPTSHDVPQPMMLTARYYGQEANRLRDHHQEAIKNGELVPELEELGIPHPHVWVSLIGALVAQGDKVGCRLRVRRVLLKQHGLCHGSRCPPDSLGLPCELSLFPRGRPEKRGARPVVDFSRHWAKMWASQSLSRFPAWCLGGPLCDDARALPRARHRGSHQHRVKGRTPTGPRMRAAPGSEGRGRPEQQAEELQRRAQGTRRELQRLQDALTTSEEELCIARDRAVREARAAEDAERVRCQLLDRLAELTAQASTEATPPPWRGAPPAATLREAAARGSASPACSASEALPRAESWRCPPQVSPAEEQRGEAGAEGELGEACAAEAPPEPDAHGDVLLQEVASAEEQLRRLRERTSVHALEHAEAEARAARDEAAAMRKLLVHTEAEGRKIKEEHSEAEAQAVPLRDWVEHTSEQLAAARAKVSEMSAANGRLAADRERLENAVADHARAAALAAQVHWHSSVANTPEEALRMREDESWCARRRALLGAEIAAQRSQRDALQRQARRLREEAAASERREWSSGGAT
ncbi:unnamed protein product, partial [Prorocentrum cordatum]